MSGEGILTYLKDGAEVFTTQSWENALNFIPAKSYPGCSKTVMQSKNRPAIFIPDELTGKKGIFIHEGKNQLWSEGCICIEKQFMDQLLNSVSGELGAITVTVSFAG